MATLLADEYLTARKQHTCDACLGIIGIGDRYHRQRLVDGGDAWVWKGHALCSRIVCSIGEDFGDGIETNPDEVRSVLADVLAIVGAGATQDEEG